MIRFCGATYRIAFSASAWTCLCSAGIVGKRATSRLPAVELGVFGLSSEKAKPAASKKTRATSEV